MLNENFFNIVFNFHIVEVLFQNLPIFKVLFQKFPIFEVIFQNFPIFIQKSF